MPLDPQIAVAVVAIAGATRSLIVAIFRAVQDYRVALIEARRSTGAKPATQHNDGDNGDSENRQQDQTLERPKT